MGTGASLSRCPAVLGRGCHGDTKADERSPPARPPALSPAPPPSQAWLWSALCPLSHRYLAVGCRVPPHHGSVAMGSPHVPHLQTSQTIGSPPCLQPHCSLVPHALSPHPHVPPVLPRVPQGTQARHTQCLPPKKTPSTLCAPHLKTSTKHSCSACPCTWSSVRGRAGGDPGQGVPRAGRPRCPVPQLPPTSRRGAGTRTPAAQWWSRPGSAPTTPHCQPQPVAPRDPTATPGPQDALGGRQLWGGK